MFEKIGLDEGMSFVTKLDEFLFVDRALSLDFIQRGWCVDRGPDKNLDQWHRILSYKGRSRTHIPALRRRRFFSTYLTTGSNSGHSVVCILSCERKARITQSSVRPTGSTAPLLDGQYSDVVR